MAAYAIGQVAFESRAPLTDCSGLIMPEAQRFLGSPDAMRSWAIRRGTRYAVAEPRVGDRVLLEVPVPVTGWHVRPSFYQRKRTLALVALGDSP